MRVLVLFLLAASVSAQTTVVQTNVNFYFKGLVGAVQPAKPNTTAPSTVVSLPGQSTAGQFSLVTQAFGYTSLFLRKSFEGFVAYQQRGTVSTRPAIIIFPDFMNVEENTKEYARKLGDLGYIAFVADYYGKKYFSRTTREQVAAAFDLGKQLAADRTTYIQTINAIVDSVGADPKVDRTRIGFLGYGYGGTVILDALRSGISAHTSIIVHPQSLKPTPSILSTASVWTSGIFPHIGFFDKNTPSQDFVGFIQEMATKSVLDWTAPQFRAVGCFSDPNAEQLGTIAPDLFNVNDCKYDAKSATRSWNQIIATFGERFGA